MWMILACGSAIFAGITSILAKCGIRKTDSDLPQQCGLFHSRLGARFGSAYLRPFSYASTALFQYENLGSVRLSVNISP